MLFWLVVGLLALATYALRAFNLDRSWDGFVEEISYLRLSRSAARGAGT